jgi:hypothetical protein
MWRAAAKDGFARRDSAEDERIVPCLPDVAPPGCSAPIGTKEEHEAEQAFKSTAGPCLRDKNKGGTKARFETPPPA